jgi:hypothetical protein
MSITTSAAGVFAAATELAAVGRTGLTSRCNSHISHLFFYRPRHQAALPYPQPLFLPAERNCGFPSGVSWRDENSVDVDVATRMEALIAEVGEILEVMGEAEDAGTQVVW